MNTNVKTYIKAFVVGASYPMIVSTMLYIGLASIKRPEALTFPYVVLALIPVFGVVNMLAVAMGISQSYGWMALLGAVFGLLLSLVGTFLADAPRKLFGWTGIERYRGIMVAPFLYAAIWGLMGTSLNRLMFR